MFVVLWMPLTNFSGFASFIDGAVFLRNINLAKAKDVIAVNAESHVVCLSSSPTHLFAVDSVQTQGS